MFRFFCVVLLTRAGALPESALLELTTGVLPEHQHTAKGAFFRDENNYWNKQRYEEWGAALSGGGCISMVSQAAFLSSMVHANAPTAYNFSAADIIIGQASVWNDPEITTQCSRLSKTDCLEVSSRPFAKNPHKCG